MFSGENESQKTEGYFSRAPERGFDQRISELTERAFALKVRMHVSVQRGNELLYGDDTTIFGASIGKLPLADMVINMMYSDETWTIDKDIIDSTGGGIYDRGETSEATTAELLDDMLRNSGNTAYRVLARGLGGPSQINSYYRNKWFDTRVDEDGDTGRALLSETTANESLLQIREIIFGLGGDERLRQRAWLALQNSSANDRGIRKYLADSSDIVVFNKTGEYNGDKNDPLVFRHDTGFVKGPQASLSYAVLTSSPMKMRGFIANSVVAQFGAEIARAANGHDAVSLGSRALRFVL